MTVTTRIDHLVVTAPDLASGADLVRRVLGVELQAGGKHTRIGTHNLLLKLGDSVYLEVIAPDPDTPDPGRPRWFDLDRRDPPRLATWAARTSDIRSAAAAASEPLGPVEQMTRGDMRWQITIPPDGKLVLGGAAPALIEWRAANPATTMRDAGCSLTALELVHPEPRRVSALLESISLQDEVSVVSGPRPALVARFQTAAGPRTLGP
jgi:hypothetical protein